MTRKSLGFNSGTKGPLPYYSTMWNVVPLALRRFPTALPPDRPTA